MKRWLVGAIAALSLWPAAGFTEDGVAKMVEICRHTVMADADSRRYCANFIAEHGGQSPLPKQIEPTETMIDLGPANYPSTGRHMCQLMRCWDHGTHHSCQAQTFVSAGPC